MTPAPIALPATLRDRLGTDAPDQLTGLGNAALLMEPLLGLVASRECPGHVLLETLDRVPHWVTDGRVIVSGFHSPLEQQVLRSLLRRRGRAVKLLARGMADTRPAPDEADALSDGRMLILSPFAPSVTRTTRATALARNRLVLVLAAEVVIPHVADGSPLAALIETHRHG